MRIKVLFNPVANSQRAGGQLGVLEAAFHAAGLDYDLVLLRAPGHACEEALRASADFDLIVAAGGDGTINEVVNGILEAAGDGPARPLAIIPLGTANDFCDLAGFTQNISEAAVRIATGETMAVDVGQLTCGECARRHTHFFINNCALAMEPFIAREATRLTQFSGVSRYLAATARGLAKLRAWHMHVSWDEGAIDAPLILLSIANSPRTGGRFIVAPAARIDDGRLNVIFAPAMPKVQVLTIFPRLFRGTHVDQQKVKHVLTERLFVTSNPPSPIHIDGELLPGDVTAASIQVLPQRLTLLKT